MKKRIILVLAAAAAISVMLTGCARTCATEGCNKKPLQDMDYCETHVIGGLTGGMLEELTNNAGEAVDAITDQINSMTEEELAVLQALAEQMGVDIRELVVE